MSYLGGINYTNLQIEEKKINPHHILVIKTKFVNILKQIISWTLISYG